jgi:hypothetical protein
MSNNLNLDIDEHDYFKSLCKDLHKLYKDKLINEN